MLSKRARLEKSMQGVVVPVVPGRSLGADVLADVAARYGVGVAAGARAVQVPPGACAETYAVNALGQQVWVRGVLAVDGVVTGDLTPVGYFEARGRAAACQIRQRKVRDVPGESKAAVRAETLAQRNAGWLLRVREMVSLGHGRADVQAALNISCRALRSLTAGAGIVWPHTAGVKVAKAGAGAGAKAGVKVAKAGAGAGAGAKAGAEQTPAAVERARVWADRLVQVRAMARDGVSKSHVAQALNISWMMLQNLTAGTDIVFVDGNSNKVRRLRELADLQAAAAQGLTRTQAAAALNMHMNTLHARVKDTDIVFREGRGGNRAQPAEPVAKAKVVRGVDGRHADAVALYNAGMLQRDIAAKLGFAFSTVSTILRKAGVEGARKRAAVARTAAMVAAVRAGGAPSAVAAQFNCTVRQVRVACMGTGVSCAEVRRGPAAFVALRRVALRRVQAAGDTACLARIARDMGLSRNVLSRWVNAERQAAADAPALRVAA